MAIEKRRDVHEDVLRAVEAKASRPLYAGVKYKASTSWKGDPIKIALPLVRWIDKDRPTT